MRGRAKEDGQKEYGRHDGGQNDVEDVEGVSPSDVNTKDDVGELLSDGRAANDRLISRRCGTIDLPLTVLLEIVEIHLQ